MLAVLSGLWLGFNLLWFWNAGAGTVFSLFTGSWVAERDVSPFPRGSADYFEHQRMAQTIVAFAACTTLLAATLAVLWLFRRGRMSRRLRWLWLATLLGAWGGWPVACSCFVLGGMKDVIPH